jgi:surfactin synthase thioesterase subunit
MIVMRLKAKWLGFWLIGLAIGCTVASQGAFAYQVEGLPEKGFFIVDLATTAPVTVRNRYFGKDRITPQEYLDKRCVGAKVSEINVLRYSATYTPISDAIQIVFVMPKNGCAMANPD